MRGLSRPTLGCLLLTIPGLADAAERRWLVGSFDHVWVEGPFEVRVSTGAPSASGSGDDDALDAVDVQQNGSTVVVQASTGERPRGTGRIVIDLATPALAGAVLTGSGHLTIAGLHAPSASLRVAGSGQIDAGAVAADQVDATLVGTGRIALAGRAARARLTTSGTGLIDAAALDADEVTVRLDGPGDTRASARYAADVTSTGLGSVTVTGPATCQIAAPAGGSVHCGDARTRTP